MSTVTSSHLVAVQSLARRVQSLDPRGAEQIALVEFMCGALHSLTRAIQCRFEDARMTPDLAAMRVELIEVVRRIVLSQEPPRSWLSGYYIDSAMMRLAALGERLGDHLKRPQPLNPEVPDAVNKMKHQLDAGIGAGWEARFEDVLKAAEDLWPLLAAAVPLASPPSN